MKKVAMVAFTGFSVTLTTLFLFCWLRGIDPHDSYSHYFTTLGVALLVHLLAARGVLRELEDRTDA